MAFPQKVNTHNHLESSACSSEDHNRSTVKRMYSSVFSMVPYSPLRSTTTKMSVISQSQISTPGLNSSLTTPTSSPNYRTNFAARECSKDTIFLSLDSLCSHSWPMVCTVKKLSYSSLTLSQLCKDSGISTKQYLLLTKKMLTSSLTL